MQGSVTRLYTENIDIKFHNTLTITITHTHTHTPEVLINTQEQQEKSQIALRSRLFGYLNRVCLSYVRSCFTPPPVIYIV